MSLPDFDDKLFDFFAASFVLMLRKAVALFLGSLINEKKAVPFCSPAVIVSK